MSRNDGDTWDSNLVDEAGAATESSGPAMDLQTLIKKLTPEELVKLVGGLLEDVKALDDKVLKMERKMTPEIRYEDDPKGREKGDPERKRLFDISQGLAKKNVFLKQEVKGLRHEKADLERENQQLTQDNAILEQYNVNLDKYCESLERENLDLKTQALKTASKDIASKTAPSIIRNAVAEAAVKINRNSREGSGSR